METKIKNIMASVFHCDESDINENSSPDTIEQWDSLRHMHLIVALEEEFGVTFKENEIIEMMSYSGVYTVLKGKNIS